MMPAERKISLPTYKMAYAACFVVILSLIRGISLSDEIGIAMEAPMAVLAVVFCADTYTQEIIQTVRDTPLISLKSALAFHCNENGNSGNRLIGTLCGWLRNVFPFPKSAVSL
ncbi:MAG: hypothetical protein Q4E24_16535 [bacterium]|nr:hypothetical protein [bacterium]